MAKRTPGLRKKGEIWHIEKVIAGQLVRQSTGETELEQAERYLAQLIENRRKEKVMVSGLSVLLMKPPPGTLKNMDISVRLIDPFRRLN